MSQTMPYSPMLSAALALADLGYRVFPVRPGAKTPIVEHGVLDASADPEVIAAWWAANPEANIGLSTQGLLVVDIDGRDNQWLADRPDRMGELAGNPLSITGNGGQQIFFRQPAGAGWRNTAGKIAPKVDTRADGGYVVVPPSVLVGDRHYRWVVELEAPDRLSEPPRWLCEALGASRPSTPSPASPGVPSGGNPIPQGQRNDALARLAGVMRRAGMTQPEIAAALLRANQERCKPPLEQAEVERIAASISRYEPDQVAVAVAEGHYQQDRAGTGAGSAAFPAGAEAGAPPAIPSVRELVAAFPRLRPPVIHDLLREGETMNVISAPKVGKSWLVTDLALSLATGRDWLGRFRCEQGDVLILDNELHPETSAHRIPIVGEARAMSPDQYADHVFILNLRGRLQDVFTLGALFDSIQPKRYKAIILDAFYRFMPRDMDENDNGTMASVYNLLDRYADRLGCSFILIHHTSKGVQGGKAITDVGAGAGSQSRATDTHLVLRPHEQDGAVVLDAAVRSWAPLTATCLRWTFPVWQPAPDLDPTQFKGDKRREEAESLPPMTLEVFLSDVVSSTPTTKAELAERAKAAGCASVRLAERLLKDAEQAGRVFRWYYGSNQPARFANVAQPADGSSDE